MKLNVIQNSNTIDVIPSIYKDLKNPPKFIFRSPNSQDYLHFMWGGNNVFDAVCNCFLGFENKIELEINGKPYEYNTYKEFINAGLNGEIAIIHSECMNAVANRLMEMAKAAALTEKKLQSDTNCGKKGQEDKTTTQAD